MKTLDRKKQKQYLYAKQKANSEKSAPVKMKMQKEAYEARKYSKKLTIMWIFKLPFLTIHKWIQSGYFKAEGLLELHIDWCKMKSAEMNVFQKHNFQNVHTMSLNRNKLNHLAIKEIGKAKWTNLQRIHITQNSLSKNSIRQLFKMDLPKLQILVLRFCSIQSSSYQIISKNNFPSLKKCNLSQNYINQNDVHIIMAHIKQKQKLQLLKNMNLIQKLEMCISVMSSKKKLQYCESNNVSVKDFYFQFPDSFYKFED